MQLKNLFGKYSWVTSVSIVERVAALGQTIVVARILGVREYGVYGLLMGSIGLTASIAALQLGLTATVFISRYREFDKPKAAFIVDFSTKLSLVIVVLFLVAVTPFNLFVSKWLFSDSAHGYAVIAGCFLVGLSIVGGVQDGIVQGFEDFRTIAVIRMLATLFSLVLIYPLGHAFQLAGVLLALLIGPAFKCFYLVRVQKMHCRKWNFPDKGAGVNPKELLWGFSIPSMAASLMSGFAAWYGMYLLSKQSDGFDSVAIVSISNQWKSPVLLLISAVTTVLVPEISRSHHLGDSETIERLRRRALLFNGTIAFVSVVIIASLAPLFFRAYGIDFSVTGYLFPLLVASAIPQAVATALMQELVGMGKMWRQNLLYLFLVIPMSVGFHLEVSRRGALGYAWVVFASWSVFFLALLLGRESSARKTIRI
jgi:O-antigen/teichoic acid export membrane protein